MLQFISQSLRTLNYRLRASKAHGNIMRLVIMGMWWRGGGYVVAALARWRVCGGSSGEISGMWWQLWRGGGYVVAALARWWVCGGSPGEVAGMWWQLWRGGGYVVAVLVRWRVCGGGPWCVHSSHVRW